MRVKRPLWTSVALYVKDGVWARQDPWFLATPTVYGEPMANIQWLLPSENQLTVSSTAKDADGQERCTLGELSPLHWGHQAVKDWPWVRQSSSLMEDTAQGKTIFLSFCKTIWWNQPPSPAPKQTGMSVDFSWGSFVSCFTPLPNRQGGQSKDCSKNLATSDGQARAQL